MASAQKTHYRHTLPFIKRVSNNVCLSIIRFKRNFTIKKQACRKQEYFLFLLLYTKSPISKIICLSNCKNIWTLEIRKCNNVYPFFLDIGCKLCQKSQLIFVYSRLRNYVFVRACFMLMANLSSMKKWFRDVNGWFICTYIPSLVFMNNVKTYLKNFTATFKDLRASWHYRMGWVATETTRDFRVKLENYFWHIYVTNKTNQVNFLFVQGVIIIIWQIWRLQVKCNVLLWWLVIVGREKHL